MVWHARLLPNESTMLRTAPIQTTPALRGFRVACLLGATLAFGCDRGDRLDSMNPQPESGFSETVSVGNRGTEKGGFFERGETPPRAAESPLPAAPSASAAPAASTQEAGSPKLGSEARPH